MTDFEITDSFKGYQTKADPTNIDPRFLVAPSQNVIINDGEKVENRTGYILDGSSSVRNTPVHSAADFILFNGNERNIKGYGTYLAFRYTAQDGTIFWPEIKSDLSGDTIRFTSFWSASEARDKILFVDNTSNIHVWTGAVSTVNSTTTNTITKQGIVVGTTISFSDSGPDMILDSNNGFINAGFTVGDNINVSGSASNNGNYKIAAVTAGEITLVGGDTLTTEAAGATVTVTRSSYRTWAEDGFTNSAGTVVIEGTEYSYTGGDTTGTLTGVTPDPTSITNRVMVYEKVSTLANSSITDLPNTIKNTYISILTNQVYIADSKSRLVYISKVGDYTDFGFSSPRLTSDGEILTLNGNVTGFIASDTEMYISAGSDQWYFTKFELSSDLVNRLLQVRQLKTGAGQGASTQEFISKSKNAIMFVSADKTLSQLAQVENIVTPQTQVLSDPVKPDFEEGVYLFGDSIYWKDKMYIAVPSIGKVFIYDTEKGYWQPPHTLPVRRFSIIGGHLYGHSSTTEETYQLYVDGVFSDNNNVIYSRARFPYNSFGRKNRAKLKNYSFYYTEGYISPNTALEHRQFVEFEGAETVKAFDIDGDDDSILFSVQSTSSIGKSPLGKNPAGSSLEKTMIKQKFRIVNTTNIQEFFEMGVEYSTNATGAAWEILAHGPNVKVVDGNVQRITK